MNEQHLTLIDKLMLAGEAIDLPLWLGGGWAVDARLGKITPDHGDIDLAIPAERMEDFKTLLHAYKCGPIETTDYGFLVLVARILLDCEPCQRAEQGYEFAEVPLGSCPQAKEGILNGRLVRCTSWVALLWDYFYYEQEVSPMEWPAKDHERYRLVYSVLGERKVAGFRQHFFAHANQMTTIRLPNHDVFVW